MDTFAAIIKVSSVRGLEIAYTCFAAIERCQFSSMTIASSSYAANLKVVTPLVGFRYADEMQSAQRYCTIGSCRLLLSRGLGHDDAPRCNSCVSIYKSGIEQCLVHHRNVVTSIFSGFDHLVTSVMASMVAGSECGK